MSTQPVVAVDVARCAENPAALSRGSWGSWGQVYTLHQSVKSVDGRIGVKSCSLHFMNITWNTAISNIMLAV